MTHWQPTASIEALQARARIVACIRSFFSDREVVEVTTPVITSSGVTDPNIESIALAGRAEWLRTSPEYWHKRLLAAGFGDLYELGPTFRDGEHGRLNRNEFILLEWYRQGWSWRELAAEAVELVQACTGNGRTHQPVEYRSWLDCFEAAVRLDPFTASNEALADAAEDAPSDCSRDVLLDYIFATRIQPDFATDSITVVFDYPASQAALARIKPDDPRLSERFEIFIGTVELANGYRELTDSKEQRSRFEADNRTRRALGRSPMPIDQALLDALAAGLPECAGIALGVDRLVMAALDCKDITQVTAF